MKEITKNLTLVSVQENNVQGNKLLAVVCYFTFFGEEATAYISTSKIDNEYPSFGVTESTSELHDSFNELIEENWNTIIVEVKAFIKEWQLQNAE